MDCKKLFLDVNVIQTMPPNCANRDDTGSPKTCVYGGVRRARVSSQSWKRAMRESFHGRIDENELGVRTTHIVQMVADKICELDQTIGEDEAIKKAQDVITAAGITVKAKEKKSRKKKEGDEEEAPAVPEAAALFFMSRKQCENMARLAIGGDYDKKGIKEVLNAGHGIDTALFGRMVADDPSLNVDAAAQVAHAISTHRVDNEYDYYTAVDDMAPADNAGAGMIGVVEYNSSTLYRYATVAVHDLAVQLQDVDATATAVEEFVRAFVMSMPSGKQNTFANRTVPYAVYVALRCDQPVNLAPAFENPVLLDTGSGGYNAESVRRMVEYETGIRDEFVTAPVKSWQIGSGLQDLGELSDLQTVLDSIRTGIKSEI